MTSMKSHSEEIIMKQKQQYYELITDLWKYMKYYIDHLPTSVEDWTAAIETGNRMVEKHPECSDLAVKLVVNVMDELERIAKFK